MRLMKDKQKKKEEPRNHKAQSLVEFAITLPVLLLLFSGLVEFGFALNYYLSLLDATREAARYYSNFDPFLEDGSDNMAFYRGAAEEAYANLDPTQRPGNEAYQGRIIALDRTTDDVLVSVFAWSDADGLVRYPGGGTFQLFGHGTSKFTNAMIEDEIASGSPNAGLLLVEVHYNYHQVLALPFLSPFVPNPLLMRAYTIMPLSAAEPVE